LKVQSAKYKEEELPNIKEAIKKINAYIYINTKTFNSTHFQFEKKTYFVQKIFTYSKTNILIFIVT